MFVRVFYSKTHHFLVPMTNSFTQKESGNDKKKPRKYNNYLRSLRHISRYISFT